MNIFYVHFSTKKNLIFPALKHYQKFNHSSPVAMLVHHGSDNKVGHSFSLIFLFISSLTPWCHFVLSPASQSDFASVNIASEFFFLSDPNLNLFLFCQQMKMNLKPLKVWKEVIFTPKRVNTIFPLTWPEK